MKVWTDEQLAGMRKDSKLYLIQRLGYSKDVVFTCDACLMKKECRSAFDGYNTDGACLEAK